MAIRGKGRSCLLLALALCLLASLLAGCGGGTTESAAPTAAATEAPSEATAQPEAAETEAPAQETEPAGITYPLEGDTVELTLFYMLDASYGFEATDMTLWSALEEATNVHIELTWTTPMAYGEQLNVAVATGDLTDLIRNAGNQFTAGLDYAVDQGIIIALNDYLETDMPDFYAALTSDENYWNSVVTSNGTIAEANGLYYEAYGPQSGFVIRADWLEELSLEAPETIDEWHEVLTAFKTELGCDYPLWLSSAGAYTGDFFGSAYDTATMVASSKYPFYNVDGTIHFGPLEEGYYSYLELMTTWFQEGLIDPDFASATGYMFPLPPGDPATGKYGIWCTMLTMFDQYAGLSDDADFAIVPLTDPVAYSGQTTHLGFDIDYVNQGSIAITTSCDEIEAACRWINYGYTEEGILLYNFGVEGEGFTYDEAGEPVYTDLVLNNPDGLTFTAAQFRYAGGDNSPTVINFRSGWTTYSDAALSAMETWGSVSDGAYELPRDFALTSEEQEEFNNIYIDIETYITESVLRFITGEMALSEYDTFVATIEQMNIQACIDLYQGALDRCLAA